MDKKEELRRYGQLVCDFANAETSYDACLGLIDNIQHAFEFSPNFAQRAKKAFPSRRKIASSIKQPGPGLKTFKGQNPVEEKQHEVRVVLRVLVNKGELYKSGCLGNVLDNYQEVCRPQLELMPDDSLLPRSHILEESSLIFHNRWPRSPVSLLIDYTQVVNFCLVEFLRDGDRRYSLIEMSHSLCISLALFGLKTFFSHHDLPLPIRKTP